MKTYTPRGATHVVPTTSMQLESLELTMRAPTGRFALDMGLASYQANSRRCSAEAIANVAETCAVRHGARLFPRISPQRIYERAQRIDGVPDFKGGTFCASAAEAYCQLAGTKVRWMALPMEADVLARWIGVEKTGVAYATRWFQDDYRTGFSRVQLGDGSVLDTLGHAVHLFGYDMEHTWRNFPLIGKKRTSPMFLMENTNSKSNDKPFFYPFSRVSRHGLEAVVLLV